MRGLLAGRGGLGAVAFLADRGSVVVVLGFSCLSVCGTFLDQGSNPCLLRWQAGSYPLNRQGSP